MFDETEYIKEAAFAEYPFGQNNYGILNQFFLNNIDNAEYMFKRSSKHHFAMAEYNLGYLKELNGKIEESIDYYKKASEDENYPLIFRNNINNDERLRISKAFIICFVDLKLVDYYLGKSNFSAAKKFFIKAYSKLYFKKVEITYKFRFEYHKQKANENPFSYLRFFILNFPTFNLKNQPNLILNSDLFVHPNDLNAHQNNNEIKQKLQNIGSKQLLSEIKKQNDDISFVKKNDDIKKIIIFENTNDLFDFAINDFILKPKFDETIKNILHIMKNIIYTPPYAFLFGRIVLEKLKNNPEEDINPYIVDINESFYEGFGDI